MTETGAADYLASAIVSWGSGFGVTGILTGFVLVTMLLTQPLSNAAAVLVVLPLAIATAAQTGLNPRTLAVLVTLAASLSFVAPFEPASIRFSAPENITFGTLSRSAFH